MGAINNAKSATFVFSSCFKNQFYIAQLNMFHILKSEEKMRLIKYLFFALWKEAKTCDEQKMRFVIKLELKRVSKRS